jgi:hypothetical protein
MAVKAGGKGLRGTKSEKSFLPALPYFPGSNPDAIEEICNQDPPLFIPPKYLTLRPCAAFTNKLELMS